VSDAYFEKTEEGLRPPHKGQRARRVTRYPRRMKRAVVAAIVCSGSFAHAGPMVFDSFKLHGEKPALHGNRELAKPIDALKAQVASCGAPTVDPRLKQTWTEMLKLSIAADGTVSSVELDTKMLDEDTIACVGTVLRGAKFTARKKPSVLTIALVYRRSATAKFR
jgi:hypothetical protein